jgi:hypothetical protein
MRIFMEAPQIHVLRGTILNHYNLDSPDDS